VLICQQYEARRGEEAESGPEGLSEEKSLLCLRCREAKRSSSERSRGILQMGRGTASCRALPEES
jgi:hypothetical protein